MTQYSFLMLLWSWPPVWTLICLISWLTTCGGLPHLARQNTLISRSATWSLPTQTRWLLLLPLCIAVIVWSNPAAAYLIFRLAVHDTSLQLHFAIYLCTMVSWEYRSSKQDFVHYFHKVLVCRLPGACHADTPAMWLMQWEWRWLQAAHASHRWCVNFQVAMLMLSAMGVDPQGSHPKLPICCCNILL